MLDFLTSALFEFVNAEWLQRFTELEGWRRVVFLLILLAVLGVGTWWLGKFMSWW